MKNKLCTSYICMTAPLRAVCVLDRDIIFQDCVTVGMPKLCPERKTPSTPTFLSPKASPSVNLFPRWSLGPKQGRFTSNHTKLAK